MSGAWLFLCLLLVLNGELTTAFVHPSTLMKRVGHATRMHSLPKKYTPIYLERMVERKKTEVDNLLRRHHEPDDPLLMRMNYMASECKYVDKFRIC